MRIVCVKKLLLKNDDELQKAARIERERILAEIKDGYKRHGDINFYNIASITIENMPLICLLKELNMRKKRLYTDPDEVRRELQKVADKLELPVEDEAVFKEWVGQGKAVTDEVHREVFAPLYFTTSNTLHC